MSNANNVWGRQCMAMVMYGEYGDCTTKICGLAVSDPLLPITVILALSSSFLDAKSSLAPTESEFVHHSLTLTDVHSDGVSEHSQRTLKEHSKNTRLGREGSNFRSPKKTVVQFCTQITK